MTIRRVDGPSQFEEQVNARIWDTQDRINAAFFFSTVCHLVSAGVSMHETRFSCYSNPNSTCDNEYREWLNQISFLFNTAALIVSTSTMFYISCRR